MLRQEYIVGSDEAGKQIVQEARRFYYTQNTFTVQSYWLCEFVTNTLADRKPMQIEPLVRKIMVVVNLKHIDGDDPITDIDESELEAQDQ